MEGFKNSTRMKTFGEEAPQAYAKGGKVGKVMGEFAAGKLHSGSKKGPEVTSRKQAIAIGISEAKKAGVAKKNNGGLMSKMSPADRRASEEQPSRPLTAAEMRAAKAVAAAKAAAPKQGPLIKPVRQMTPAERRMNQMDRPTNNMGAEAYKGGGKVGASKVPFAVKKVMRKAEGGEVSAPPPMEAVPVGKKLIPEMPTGYAPPPPPVAYDPSQEPTPQSVFGSGLAASSVADMYGTSPGPSPTMPNQPQYQSEADHQAQLAAFKAREASSGRPSWFPEDLPMDSVTGRQLIAQHNAQEAAQRADQAATAQAQQEMAAQAQQDRGLGLNLGGRRNTQDPMYNRGGKVSGSKVMRKAEGGVVNAAPAKMYAFGDQPSIMPTAGAAGASPPPYQPQTFADGRLVSPMMPEPTPQSVFGKIFTPSYKGPPMNARGQVLSTTPINEPPYMQKMRADAANAQTAKMQAYGAQLKGRMDAAAAQKAKVQPKTGIFPVR